MINLMMTQYFWLFWSTDFVIQYVFTIKISLGLIANFSFQSRVTGLYIFHTNLHPYMHPAEELRFTLNTRCWGYCVVVFFWQADLLPLQSFPWASLALLKDANWKLIAIQSTMSCSKCLLFCGGFLPSSQNSTEHNLVGGWEKHLGITLHPIPN